MLEIPCHDSQGYKHEKHEIMIMCIAMCVQCQRYIHCLNLYLQTAVISVLRSAARDRFKVEAAIKYSKTFLCSLKGEERRKVFVT